MDEQRSIRAIYNRISNMGIYTDFWQKILNRIIKDISPTEPFESEMKVPELSQIGDRPSAGYNGRLFTWAGQMENRTDSSIFRNLEEVIAASGTFRNRVPGQLQLRIYANSVLKIEYRPVSFELLIERYRKIAVEKKMTEIEKWQLIKLFQLAWVVYQAGDMSFVNFWKKVNFGHLVFHTGLTVFAHVLKEKPGEFEKLLLGLYDESKDLKKRITDYTNGFAGLYYSLPGHGKNTFQEERTIATLLAFRYPEKYALFKDSFYSKLSKGLGVKPYPTGEKIFHYYSLVDDFTKNVLMNHPDIIDEKNSRLDKTCYIDNNNLILAQDILYLTLDAKETQEDKEEDIEDEPEHQTTDKKIKMTQLLNSILYGPPGTGKTYHTINKSVAIANPEFDILNASREELKAEYERLVKDGQIEFITFHQSMSYEDFIEGIKPVEPKEGDPFLKYEIKEGIFKRLCERASKVPDAKPAGFSIDETEFQKAGFYKISLGDTSNPDDDQIYDWCIQHGYIALGWGDAIDFTGKKENEIQQMVPNQLEKFAATAVNAFVHYIKPGDYVVVTYGNLLFRAIGKVTGAYEYKNVDGLNVHQFRKVDWLMKDIELPYEEVYDRQFMQQSIYRMDKKGIKRDFFVKTGKATPVRGKQKNYVLIIDEINRGNVSQIFGELITLIEEDKRTSREEALTVTLPYSKKSFSVPQNLYIIGTMNTADRSVEALDTALRRRFVFEQLLPDEKLLSPQNMILRLYERYAESEWDDESFRKEATALYGLIGIDKSFESTVRDDENEYYAAHEKILAMLDDRFTGLNLQTLLMVMNERLRALLSKDHAIGHAWLINVYSLTDLQLAFKNKILPLLQEFFYNDYAKIGLVLGRAFVRPAKFNQSVFATFNGSDELSGEYVDKVIYEMEDPMEVEMDGYKSIYQNG